jgi:hypothetical protein
MPVVVMPETQLLLPRLARFHELLAPARQRLLADPVASSNLRVRFLPPQHRQHRFGPLLDGYRALPAHASSPVVALRYTGSKELRSRRVAHAFRCQRSS